MDLTFWLDAFPFDDEILFLFIYEKLIYCLENDLESSLIFVLFFYFKRVNKIRKKTLRVTPYSKKGSVKNQIKARGLGYLLGKYGKDHNTPLSP